jgi:MFS family permease
VDVTRAPQRFLRKIYLYSFLDDFVLIYPLYAVMFTEKGMAPLQVGTLFTVWSVTAFLLEVPSGAWADRYSRKHILFIGQVIRAVGYACWLVYPTFWGFLAGFIFWGIESALSSGTKQALVYDELKQFGREADFTKVIGRCRTFSLAGLVVSSFLASPGILLGYPFILIGSSCSVLLAGLVILTIPQAHKVDSTGEEAYWSTLTTGLRGAFQQPAVLRFIIFLALATALPGALDEYWTIFADEAGLPDYGLGIFLGVLCTLEAIGSFFAHYVEKRKDRFFHFLFLFIGLLLLLAAYWFNVAALALLIVFTLTATIIQIIFEGRLQHAIEGNTRATISSVGGFLTEIGAFIVFFTFGWMAQEQSYREAFGAYGVIIMLVGMIYLIFNFRKKGF